MKNAIGKLINKFRNEFKDDKIIVAISGGVDSMLVAEIALMANCNVHFFHFHHGQGIHDDSCFTKFTKMMVRNEVSTDRYLAIFGDIKTYFDKSKGFECSARLARYSEMRKYSDEIGSKKILTGHNLNDQIETIMMQITRGIPTDSIGMAKITHFRNTMTVYRPLLDMSKSEIYKIADALGLDWHEDETNTDTTVERNMWRNDIIPELMKRRNILKTIPNSFNLKDEITVNSDLFE